MRTLVATRMADEQRRVVILTDLSEDDVLCVLCLCDRMALGAVAACSHFLHAVASDDMPWRKLLYHDFDVLHGESLGNNGNDDPRSLYRSLTASPIFELSVSGMLTDGGMDQAVLESRRPPLISEGMATCWAVDQAWHVWVSNVFEPDQRCFSSDVHLDGSAAANVLIAGRIKGSVSALSQERRQEEEERRRFLVARLSFVLQEFFQMPMDGFGGIESATSELLDQAYAEHRSNRQYLNTLRLLPITLDGA